MFTDMADGGGDVLRYGGFSRGLRVSIRERRTNLVDPSDWDIKEPASTERPVPPDTATEWVRRTASLIEAVAAALPADDGDIR